MRIPSKQSFPHTRTPQDHTCRGTPTSFKGLDVKEPQLERSDIPPQRSTNMPGGDFCPPPKPSDDGRDRRLPKSAEPLWGEVWVTTQLLEIRD